MHPMKFLIDLINLIDLNKSQYQNPNLEIGVGHYLEIRALRT